MQNKQRLTVGRAVIASIVLSLAISLSPAQQINPAVGLTISQAVDEALRNYPAITVSQEQINAAAAGIELARTAYLPRVDSLAQIISCRRQSVIGSRKR